MLWQDPVLSARTKWRVLIYSVVGTIAFALLFTWYEIHALNHALQSAGVDL